MLSGSDQPNEYNNYDSPSGPIEQLGESYQQQQNLEESQDSSFFGKVLRISAETTKQSSKRTGRRPKSKFRVVNNEPGIHPRPLLSYNELIIEAIQKSENGMLSLQEIYDYIQNNYIFFRDSNIAWQNSIRHNLSVQKMFERVPRASDNPGKGGLWTILPWALDNQKNKRRRFEMQESHETCVNSPIAPSLGIQNSESYQNQSTRPSPEIGKGTHLMDTLATLALSVESHQPVWNYAEFDPNSFLQSPFNFNSNVEMNDYKYNPILDPTLGEKTLLQATYTEDSNSNSII